jgi:hypothetical protein
VFEKIIKILNIETDLINFEAPTPKIQLNPKWRWQTPLSIRTLKGDNAVSPKVI